MDFVDAVKELKRLQYDSEKKLIQFDEIVPLEHNEPKLYSPILVNLMLELGPQIEDVTNLISQELNLNSKKGIPARINEINRDGVLDSFTISSPQYDATFSSFPESLWWWKIYNSLKHDLSKSQFNVDYHSVVHTAAALAALHRLADMVVKIIENLDNSSQQEYKKYLLKKESWREISFGPNSPAEGWMSWGNTGMTGGPNVWRSKLFEISNYFIYESNIVLKSFRENASESQKPHNITS